MYLLQPNRLRRQTQLLTHAAAVLSNRLWRIPDAGAQVQRIVRRNADATRSQRECRPDTRRRRPIGCNQLQVSHLHRKRTQLVATNAGSSPPRIRRLQIPIHILNQLRHIGGQWRFPLNFPPRDGVFEL
jgi:hypothetical protein